MPRIRPHLVFIVIIKNSNNMYDMSLCHSSHVIPPLLLFASFHYLFATPGSTGWVDPKVVIVSIVAKGPSTRDDFVVHNFLCATCLIVWTGKSSENQSCTTSRKVVHDLEKSRPMFYFGATNSIPGVETANHTAHFVAMTTRYDVVFYLT